MKNSWCGSVLTVALLAASAAAQATFAAVSVRPVSSIPGSRHTNSHSDAKHLEIEASPHRLVLEAYGITSHQLSGEPGWFNSSLYSVRAVTSSPTSYRQMLVMLRTVLARRFGLELRQETRSAPAYLLEVAPGGPKFKALPPGTASSSNSHETAGTLTGTYTSTAGLVQTLNDAYGGQVSLDRPVVDQTHLNGAYAIKFETKVVRQRNPAGPTTLSFPDLFRDFRSELGLVLVRGQTQETDYVVEHASKPGPD